MRKVPSAGQLHADVEGHIEEVDGVVRITRINLRYHIRVPKGMRAEALRALEVYADKCPAYLSVKGCIECAWEADIEEQP